MRGKSLESHLKKLYYSSTDQPSGVCRNVLAPSKVWQWWSWPWGSEQQVSLWSHWYRHLNCLSWPKHTEVQGEALITRLEVPTASSSVMIAVKVKATDYMNDCTRAWWIWKFVVCFLCSVICTNEASLPRPTHVSDDSPKRSCKPAARKLMSALIYQKSADMEGRRLIVSSLLWWIVSPLFPPQKHGSNCPLSSAAYCLGALLFFALSAWCNICKLTGTWFVHQGRAGTFSPLSLDLEDL